MLFQILVLVVLTFLCQILETLSLDSSIIRLGSRATVRIVAVIELIGVDELSLVFVLVIWLYILLGKAAFERLVVSRIAAFLNRTWLNRAENRHVVLSNRVIRQQVLILDSEHVLITATWLNVCSLLALLGNERFLSKCHALTPFIISISDRICSSFMELVMIFKQLEILVHILLSWSATAEICICDGLEARISRDRFNRATSVVWVPFIGIERLHLS